MLAILRSFFTDCQEQGLHYSIWKSLENLDEQLSGTGDIDVVFDSMQRSKILQHLTTHSFIFDSGSPATVGSDVLVYRGFDQPTGIFTTLHVHFNCRFGSKTHKECRYAHEDEMFRDQVLYQGILRLCDGHFFAIRLLTIAVRERTEDAYVQEIARRYLEGLQVQDTIILDRRIEEYFDCAPTDLMREVAALGPSVLHRYRKIVEKAIDLHEPRSVYICHVDATRCQPRPRHRLSQALGRGRSKLDRPAGIVITGPDGAGKSTVCDLLRTQFSKLGPTYVLYLGRREWRPFNTAINRLRMKRGWSLLLAPVWPLTSTAELLLRALKGRAHTWLGGYVIYDRSLYDNVLKFSNKHGLAGHVARAISSFCAARHGDVCFFLHADPHVARDRKPAGKYSVEYLTEIRRRFADVLPESYRPIDSSALTPEQVANQIVSAYFGEAASWEKRF